MNYKEAVDSVAEILSKSGEPLTESQKIVMAGAMTVWLEKSRQEGLDWAKSMAIHCREIGINYP